VLNIKNKDLIMLGMIVGISFFFIGAIISNVFPSSATNLTSYKVSGFIKLIGIGALTTSMVIGGIIVEGIDKNLKFLLLLLGLVLLIIYTVGSTWLIWDLSVSGMSGSSGETAYKERPTALGTPGFETIYLVIAMIILVLIAKVKRHRF